MLKISIPDPCAQSWDAMIPNEEGRQCSACAKTVVDFSVMTDTQVQAYLIEKANERICGRFKNAQLESINIIVPQDIFHSSMPWWKKFLVASLFAFSTTLFSCEPSVTVGIAMPEIHSAGALIATNNNDSIPKINATVEPVCTVLTGSGYTAGAPMIAGEIVMAPPVIDTIPNLKIDTGFTQGDLAPVH